MTVSASAGRAAFFAHHAAEQIAHVCFDLFRVFAGFEAFDGRIEVFGNSAGRHQVFHLAHHVRHVLGIVFVQMFHVALQFAHEAHHTRIIHVGHIAAGFVRITGAGSGRFLRSAWHGEGAHLPGHLLQLDQQFQLTFQPVQVPGFQFDVISSTHFQIQAGAFKEVPFS